ncbi:copper amine oxidase N-terminal domain-containing protein, partial [Anaerotignum faecicola]|nr:copper amine oxidase N-terminal domain-containing protein [Anaerotignum faecicola]
VGLMSAATVQGAVPKAEVNGQEIELSATPYETGGAVMVPLMDFMHVFNTNMAYWDGETKSAYMDDGLKVTAGTEEAAVIKKYGWTPGENEEYLKVYKLEKLPVIINGKMMVPVSFLVEYAQGAAEFAYDAVSG